LTGGDIDLICIALKDQDPRYQIFPLVFHGHNRNVVLQLDGEAISHSVDLRRSSGHDMSASAYMEGKLESFRLHHCGYSSSSDHKVNYHVCIRSIVANHMYSAFESIRLKKGIYCLDLFALLAEIIRKSHV